MLITAIHYHLIIQTFPLAVSTFTISAWLCHKKQFHSFYSLSTIFNWTHKGTTCSVHISWCSLWEVWGGELFLSILSELSLISLHWFLTAFASVVHMKVLLRMWDLFFYEGSVVFFQLTLGMLKMKVSVIIITLDVLGQKCKHLKYVVVMFQKAHSFSGSL